MATATLMLAAMAAGPAHADFGPSSFSATFHEPHPYEYLDQTNTVEPVLLPDLRAGAHPDLTVDFKFNERPGGPSEDPIVPDERLRDAEVDLPVGFYGNPQNRQTCTQEEFVADNQTSTGTKVGTICNKEAQVGIAVIQTGKNPAYAFQYKPTVPIYNMQTGKDDTAVLAFGLSTVPVTMFVSPRTDGDYGLTAKVIAAPTPVTVYGIRVILWGNPSDPIHDQARPDLNGSYNVQQDDDYNIIGNTGFPSVSPPLPFLTSPARCDAPLVTEARLRSWEKPGRTVTATSIMPPRTGCDQLSFAPTLAARPTSSAAGQPTGIGIDLNVPQTNTMESRATPLVKDVSVKLPEGMAISATAASGLEACTDEQLDTRSRAKEQCSLASKVGTATISTPLLAEKLEGSVYLGAQKSHDPASGEMYRLFLTAYAKGVRVKLKGSVVADPKTGQLTTTFKQNPQLPFDDLKLQLKDGPRALLVNPLSCGRHTTTTTVSSYAGQTKTSESAFATNQACPTGQFAPGFTAGTVNPFAGGLSPFVMTTTRTDADQDLRTLRLDLPSGLLGALGKVPVCADAQAAAGTCGADTRLGSTTVAVGTGANPFSLGGTVSLAGPYKGAPFSLSIAVPAKAGPLDLGMVVVRSPLLIDAANARVSAPVDDLPQIVGGVPLHYRSISVALDRPGFMFNATNCSAQTLGGTFNSANGTVQRSGVRYQAQGCGKLKLTPSLRMSYTGKGDLKKGKNPGLTAELRQTFGQAGLKQVQVTLPTVSSLRPENARALCTTEQAAARACPDASIVGRASATTPALHQPLSGPVYFVKGTRTTAAGKVVASLPKLWLKLRGDGVDLDLHADTAVSRKRLVTTFTNIPDAPIANFKLEISGGKNGILAAVEDPCTAVRRTDVQFDGQNGGRQVRALNISVPECGTRASVKATSTSVRLGLTGIGAGKVSVSGRGLISSSRKIKGSDHAAIIARLTAATRRKVASGRTVRLRLTATFDPAGAGKTVRIARSVTIKGASRR